MASIDERVVAMSFENEKFEAKVAITLSTLAKLNVALKDIGKVNGLQNIEAQANKITLAGPMSALDKLKAKISGTNSGTTFTDIEKDSNKVTLEPPITALDKLEGKLGSTTAGDTFTNIEKESAKVEFHALGSAIDSVSAKFSIIEGAAAVALGNIVTKATLAGNSFAKSFSFGPLQQGFQEYSTNLNSIQTILANTQASGAGLKDVNQALQELNKYSDQTIYNFSEMAKNIGTFTAAGVDLKTATGSIKGIANLAALSGSNSQQASTAMYQLSQAISAGRVSLQDWNSVVNAGMGGTVFQRALATTAENMGTLDKGAVKLTGKMKNATINGQSFRESITARPGEKSWLTSDVLTKTLQQFTGDLSEAELKAQGFTDEQIKAIQQTAKTAKHAATEVKTIGQVFDVAKETLGSGWAKTFQLIFGNFNEAKKTFTDMSNAINGVINKMSNARNKVLKDWKELGGRTKLLEGIRTIFHALGTVIQQVSNAFHTIFPPKTGKDLLDLTEKFVHFARALDTAAQNSIPNLRRTFKGVFALFDIGKQIVSGIFTVIKSLFGEIGKGGTDMLHFSGDIGDMIVAFDQWLKKGDKLKNFFEDIGKVVRVPIQILGSLATALQTIFGFDGDSSGLDSITKKLSPLEKLGSRLGQVWDKFIDIFGGVGDALAPVIDTIAGVFDKTIDAIGEALGKSDFDAIFAIIQTTLIGGILLTVKKALGGGLSIDFGKSGAFKTLNESLGLLKGHLVAMQTNVKANTLLQIAGAVALLAGAVVALSLVDPKKLAASMTAIAVGLAQLLAAMGLLNKLGTAGVARTTAIAGSLILIAVAIDVLALSVLALSRLSWEELLKGLAGVTGLLVVISAAAGPLGKSAPGLIRVGVALLPISIALNILAGAVALFGSMKWETIGKGLAGVAGALIAVGLAVGLIPPSILLIGPGLIAVGIALNIIAGAVKIFGDMKLESMLIGIGGIALALVAIGLAVGLMPPTLPLTAAGLILVGIALNAIGAAIALMGGMDVVTLVKGIAAIGAALVVLAGGLTLMIASLPGAAALLVAAGALVILVPLIGILGVMKWGTIFKGIGAIVIALLALGAAGLVAGPAIVILGAALSVLGLGVLAIGAGVYLLAKGVALLANEGSKGVGIFLAALTGFIALLPKIIIDFLKGLVEIIKGIADLAPKVVNALAKILILLLDVIIKAAPKFAQAVTAIITAILDILVQNHQKIIDAGFEILKHLLQGIADNIGSIVDQVADIVVKFVNALSDRYGDILAAGAKALASFLTGIANNLSKVLSAASKIVAKFIEGIGSHIADVIVAGAKLVGKIIEGIGNAVGDIVKAGAHAIVKFVTGLGQNASDIVTAGAKAAGKFINSVANAMLDLVDEAGQAIFNFLHGLRLAVDKYAPEITQECVLLGAAIVEGVGKGLLGLPKKLLDSLLSPIKDGIKKAKDIVDSHSPSRVFAEIGKNMMDGLILGIDDNAQGVVGSVSVMGNAVIQQFKDVFAIDSPSKVMHDIGKFVGQGFAQGLLGSGADIQVAFMDLNTKLKDAMTTARETINTEEDKLADLRKARSKDNEAIADAKKAIEQNQQLLDKSSAAHSYLINKLKDEKRELKTLSKQYEQVSIDLDAAIADLEAKKKARDDASTEVTNKFGSLPSFDPDAPDQLAAYSQSVTDQAAAVTKYSATLDQLRAMGLDDATYQKLLDEGTAGQKFADQLLAGGPAAVDSINALDAQLASASKTLGEHASHNLHDVGVNAAQALVDSLTTEKKRIAGVMEDIAEAMIKAIKKKLGIKSPSRVFAEVGRFSAEGMAKGLTKASTKVVDVAEEVGKDALLAMRSHLRRISDTLANEIDPNPAITPVLDLSQVQKEAKKLSDLSNVTPITAALSYRQAAAISVSEADRLSDIDNLPAVSKVFKFEQHNTSPESLSEVEIYRQTHNQLAQAKKVLNL